MNESERLSLPARGRIMGLDFGTARIGVAVSDGIRLTATAHSVVPANDSDLEARLAEIVAEYDVAAVVVGLPTSLDGSEHDSAAGARKLADRVGSSLNLPVVLYDERFTTKVAEQVMLSVDTSRRKRRKSIDKVAASVMLQGFLDRLRVESR